MPQNNPKDAALDALIQQFGSADAVAKAARGRAAKSTKDYFVTNLTSAGVKLTVADWTAFKLFLADAGTGTGVQGIYESLHSDVQDAITAMDADALITNVLLLYKAVKRG